MKYFLDTEFIEGFHQPRFGKRRHHIDLISIGLVTGAGFTFHAISSEWRYNDADQWVKDNVIDPLYVATVHGDHRNGCDPTNFHRRGYGSSNNTIRENLLDFFGCEQDGMFWRAPEGIKIYGYYADYDWVLFCSLFGRMVDLPKGFPMHCIDLKQMMDERGLGKEWKRKNCPDPVDAHNALGDAKWNRQLYNKIMEVECR